MDNIWIADLADMQLISKYNNQIQFLLCVHVFSKYALVIPLKDRKGVMVTNVFQEILDKLGCKPNKIWLDKGSEFYNRTMKSWLKDSNLEVYSKHNEGNSANIRIQFQQICILIN